jgi:hypothetical protein
MMRRVRDFIYRAVKCVFIDFRWLRKSGKFPNKLQRRRSNLVVRRGRRKVMQGLDVSAHD